MSLRCPLAVREKYLRDSIGPNVRNARVVGSSEDSTESASSKARSVCVTEKVSPLDKTFSGAPSLAALSKAAIALASFAASDEAMAEDLRGDMPVGNYVLRMFHRVAASLNCHLRSHGNIHKKGTCSNIKPGRGSMQNTPHSEAVRKRFPFLHLRARPAGNPP